MTHHLIVTLPTSELTVVRHTLNSLMTRVDELLETADFDLSLNFDGLMVSPGEFYRLYLGMFAHFHIFQKATAISSQVVKTLAQSWSRLLSVVPVLETD